LALTGGDSVPAQVTHIPNVEPLLIKWQGEACTVPDPKEKL
jgi:hypothetical protein